MTIPDLARRAREYLATRILEDEIPAAPVDAIARAFRSIAPDAALPPVPEVWTPERQALARDLAAAVAEHGFYGLGEDARHVLAILEARAMPAGDAPADP